MIAEAVRRNRFVLDDVEHLVMEQVIQTEPNGACLDRVTALKAGVPVTTPALTLNRLCGSGMQAIVSAARIIALAEADVAVAAALRP